MVTITLDENLYTQSEFLAHVDTKLEAAGLANVVLTAAKNYVTFQSPDSFKLIAFGDTRD